METVYEKDKNTKTDNNQKEQEKKDDTESLGISILNDQKFELMGGFEMQMNKDFIK